jgi:putative colanic acid biosynthesis acetyltransferase WcaF
LKKVGIGRGCGYDAGRVKSQKSPYDSPWSLSQRVKMLLWEYAWTLFCAWTPKPFNPWRLFWLKLFGAGISGRPFVHQRARIQIPWHLTLGDRSCLGDRANAYTLGEIEIGARAVVAQEAYLCTGTHDFDNPSLPLLVAKIRIGEGAFIGARAFVLPGVSIGAGAVVGACSVVTQDVPDAARVKGNPAR